MRPKAIFFDAGNTLIFPDLERTLAPLTSRGVSPTTQQLHASERMAKRNLDARLANTLAEGVDCNYWIEYHAHLLAQLNISDSELRAALVQQSRTSANWHRILPHTLEVLTQLSSSFLLGIISNSDGRIAQILQNVGIARFFDSFTDSGIVGHEKPHPHIFAAAISSLRVQPAETVYVGDIYSVDYLGAKSAGMDAVLMDVSGTYEHLEVPRIESLAELVPMFST